MANAVLYDLLTTIKTSIVNRGLHKLPTGNVVVQKVPSTRIQDLPKVPYPAVIIAPWGGETIDPGQGSNLRDDIVYPIVVAIVAADKFDQKLNFERYLGWRESIRKLFNAQRITASGSTLAITCWVKPLPIVDLAAWQQDGKFASAQVLTCISRESRG